MNKINVIITGRVQGVWFRKYTQRKAKELGLTGWVRNESNGNVALIAEGSEKLLKKFVHWLGKGAPEAEVDTVNVNWEEAKGIFNSFEIIK